MVKKLENIYLWEGIKQGRHYRGEMPAVSKDVVRAKLIKQGIELVSAKSKGAFTSGKKEIKKRITSTDITFFARQLSTMVNAGVPITQSLEIMAEGEVNVNWKNILVEVKNNVSEGTTLGDALRKYPKYFDALVCNLVAVGEQSGTLDRILDEIATYKEKIEDIKNKVKKALFYPTAIIAVAFIVTTLLMVFVVPQFNDMFASFGHELPPFTRMVVHASDFMQSYWWLIFAMIGGLIWFFIYAKKNVPPFAYFVDIWIVKIPVIGIILKKSIVSRVTRTLAITLDAGVPLVEALNSIAAVSGNMVYSDALLQVRDDISTGQQFSKSLSDLNLFPQLVIQMIDIGSQSGQLEAILKKLALFYERDVDNAVDALSSLIEPFIMVFLGLIIGTFVAAMYLPIFKLGSIF